MNTQTHSHPLRKKQTHTHLHPGNSLLIAFWVPGRRKGNPTYLFVLLADHGWIQPLSFHFLNTMLVKERKRREKEKQKQIIKGDLINWAISPLRLFSCLSPRQSLSTKPNKTKHCKPFREPINVYTYRSLIGLALEMHWAQSTFLQLGMNKGHVKAQSALNFLKVLSFAL